MKVPLLIHIDTLLRRLGASRWWVAALLSIALLSGVGADMPMAQAAKAQQHPTEHFFGEADGRLSAATVQAHQQELKNKLSTEKSKKWAFATAFAILLIFTLMIAYIGYARKRAYDMQRRYMRMRENFFTNITHEFRTPLTLILGLSHDMAQAQEGVSREVRDKAQKIETQGKSLLALVNQILDVARIKSDIGAADWRNGNISTYIEMIVECYRPYAASRGVALTYLAPDEVMMDFVPDYLSKAVNNLLSNAFKFTPERGKVSLLVRRQDNLLCIDVSDSGCGIDREALPYIFEPFYRAGHVGGHVGTGLGLPLARQAIEAMGGTVSVESEAGKGSTFHICIPISNAKATHRVEADRHATAEQVELLRTTAPNRDADRHHDYTVLVVEDNPDVAAYIGSLLADRYNVYYAEDGRVGLEKALAIHPDLVITDLMMPNMDGQQLCQHIRADENIAHTPIIIVTARITDKDRMQGLDAGADSYIAKPFNSDILLLRVEKLLEQRKQLRGAEVKAPKPPVAEATSDEARQFVVRLTDMIHSNISRGKSLDVATVAAQMCMSTSQFYRRTTETTGYTPVSFIQRVKVRKACCILDDHPQTPLAEVSAKCGFNDYSSFVRAFRNVWGITPTQYIRKTE